MKVRMTLAVTLMAICGLVFPAPRSFGASTVVNVDFNDPGHPSNSATYTGTGAAPDSDTFWNGLNANGGGAASGPLTASDGTTLTGIAVSLSNYTDSYAFGTPNVAPALLEDYAYGTTANSNFAISGLLNGRLYDLYLYSQNSSADTNSTRFAITGYGSHTVVNGGTNPSVFSLGENYVIFSGVIPTANVISGTWVDAIGTVGGSTFNGLQIVLVPEPASLGLLSVGGLMLIRRRR